MLYIYIYVCHALNRCDKGRLQLSWLYGWISSQGSSHLVRYIAQESTVLLVVRHPTKRRKCAVLWSYMPREWRSNSDADLSQKDAKGRCPERNV